MSYIEFDKTKLINLEFMLEREIVRANRGGSFACQTIVGCNTRRQHGLLIVPQPAIDGEKHILLSALHETIIQHDADFNFGIHRYKDGHNFPKGHKYVRHFSTDPNPVTIYRVGDVMLQKEMVFSSTKSQILFKYTLLSANSETKLRFRPFLAFRNINHLSKHNEYADTSFQEVKNGTKWKMYQGYSELHFQFSKKAEYFHVPDWYFNIEYFKEIEAGYEALEDLYVPGFFEIPIKKDESIYISVSLEELNPSEFEKTFIHEVNARIPRINFIQNLRNSALQFIQKSDNECEIIAGYPWYDRMGRDTFMSIPGLLVVNGDFKMARMVFDTMIKQMKNGFFPNIGKQQKTDYRSADISLWFIWALQQYALYTGEEKDIWKAYSKTIKKILNSYRSGNENGIHMTDKGLIHGHLHGKALTWMNTIIDGWPVNPRYGLCVEVNALWYNALSFSLELAEKFKDYDFVLEWKETVEAIPAHFKETFWNKEYGYLCDSVFNDVKDWRVLPNMLLASSLPYSPVSIKIQQLIVEKVKTELLTPRGIRTLSPTDAEYKGFSGGNAIERDISRHKGSVFPWLLCHYAEAYLKIYQQSGIAHIQNILQSFEETITEHGVGTISELYDGDPPHTANGAMSSALSVAEILRMGFIINKRQTQEMPL